MLTATELKALLRAHGLRLNKRLGQHYLIDPSLAARLIEACRLSPDDHVIEIGAGLGALTGHLAPIVKRVVAVEVDRAIGELLRRRLAAHPNVEVRCTDILRVPWKEHAGWKVIGTIPYQITSPILVALCGDALALADVWLGVQREVAQRLVAKPSTKAYGRLTVLVQYHFEVEQVMPIARGAFFPMPEVDSSWIHLRPRRTPAVSVADEALYFRVVQAAFAQRRKTLVNGLLTLRTPRLTRADAVQLIRHLGWSDRLRGETLSLEQFAQLGNAIQKRV